MGSATDIYALPYPSSGDPPDGPVQIEALARRVEAVLPASGQVGTGLGIVTCTSGTRPASPPAGLLIYETDTGRTWQRIGAAWVPLPGTVVAQLTRTAALPVESGIETTLAYDGEARDILAGFTTGTRYTPGVPGWYAASAFALWTANSTGYRSLSLRRGGVQFAATRTPAAPGSGAQGLVATGAALLAAGEYVEAVLTHNAGVQLTVTGSLTVDWLGA